MDETDKRFAIRPACIDSLPENVEVFGAGGLAARTFLAGPPAGTGDEEVEARCQSPRPLALRFPFVYAHLLVPWSTSPLPGRKVQLN